MTTATEKGLGLWGSELNLFIYTYIIAPLVYLAVPIAIVDYLVEKKNKLFVITTFIVIILFSIVTVSRNILVFSVIYFIFTSMIYRKQYAFSKVIKKNLKKAPVIIILAVLGIATITLLRKADANFLKEAYVYFVGALPSLTIRLGEPYADFRTYGMLSTRGFTRLIFIVLDNLGIHYPESYLRAQEIMDNLEGFIPIGNDINMNAYATLFYNFYIDGGLIGIVLFSALLGFICRKAYQGVKYNINIRNSVFFLLVIQQLLFSVARIYTVYPTRALPFLLILIMFVKVKKGKNENSRVI
ncbi:O-antigen polymerase [Siminovitchia sp. 179-K 8D1 HS]|uniref:O-antigen polymerase n=1 Tax=Siminovitchia sp. 179-K 8D1 HS TaxID=3142385 RepID=UPI00399FB53A